MKSTKILVALLLATVCVASMEAGKKRSSAPTAPAKRSVLDYRAAYTKALRTAKTAEDIQEAYNNLRTAAMYSGMEYLIGRAEADATAKITAAETKKLRDNFTENKKVWGEVIEVKKTESGTPAPTLTWNTKWGEVPTTNEDKGTWTAKLGTRIENVAEKDKVTAEDKQDLMDQFNYATANFLQYVDKELQATFDSYKEDINKIAIKK